MTHSAGNNIRVAAGIIWRGDRFLAARRPEGKVRAGHWEFPGGKQEAGESMVAVLRRELKEELDVLCESIVPWEVLIHEYSDVRVELHFMHVLEFSGEPTAREGQELRWVSPAEARTLDFLPADRPILARLERIS